jgi:hypothetical protein
MPASSAGAPPKSLPGPQQEIGKMLFRRGYLPVRADAIGEQAAGDEGAALLVEEVDRARRLVLDGHVGLRGKRQIRPSELPVPA